MRYDPHFAVLFRALGVATGVGLETKKLKALSSNLDKALDKVDELESKLFELRAAESIDVQEWESTSQAVHRARLEAIETAATTASKLIPLLEGVHSVLCEQAAEARREHHKAIHARAVELGIVPDSPDVDYSVQKCSFVRDVMHDRAVLEKYEVYSSLDRDSGRIADQVRRLDDISTQLRNQLADALTGAR